MSASNKERQRLYRQRMTELGFVQVTGWVHYTQQHEVKHLMERLQQDVDLAPGPLVNTITGRLVSANYQKTWS